MRSLLAMGAMLVVAPLVVSESSAQGAAPAEPITMVVMDPLAAPLSCDCVAGFAQRQYGRLAQFLQQKIGRRVEVVYSEALARAIRLGRTGKAHLIVGKESVVKFDAAELKLGIRPLVRLTGKDGTTTLTGLFVVPSGDKARTIADLKGYRILFGPPDADEKHAAAIAALREAGVPVPEKIETREACTESALAALEHKGRTGAAAVISSYAMALLEGCGVIERGDLRVVGSTSPVPFVTLFDGDDLPPELADRMVRALLAVREDPEVLKAMESKLGFVAAGAKPAAAAQRGSGTSADWPQWRGPARNGISPWLPEKLAPQPQIVWRKPMTGAGLSGIAATRDRLIVADRDPTDTQDVFRCLATGTGEQLWALQYPAAGELDYGNSPRATPLIHRGKVYLLGAFGDLHCVNLADGQTVWRTNLARQFGSKVTTWGMCSSPLVVDGKLIVNPGAPQASVVALDPASGRVVWQTPGAALAYASFIVGTFGGRRQLIGYDAVSLGGWDIATGERLWQLVPPVEGDFNVPTPLDAGNRLLAASENNGTRLYAFRPNGKIIATPLAEHEDLAPDTATPLLLGERVFGCWGDLFCLAPGSGLEQLWTGVDEVYEDHVAMIGHDDRILITSVQGELLLLRVDGPKPEPRGRQRVFSGDAEVLSHPALVGKRLYVRDNTTLCCVALDAE